MKTNLSWSWIITKKVRRFLKCGSEAHKSRREIGNCATAFGFVPGQLTLAPKEMEISPVTLEGQHLRLEPLSPAHEESLNAAAGDGELWNSTVTIVPSRAGMAAYIATALQAQTLGRELPFVIIRKSSGQVVGHTRFYDI